MRALAVILVSLFVVSCSPPEGTVTLDASTRYQTMSGWSTTAEIAKPYDLPAEFDRDDLFDRAVDLGINRVRLEVRAGVEHSDDHWKRWVDGKDHYRTWRAIRYANVNDNDDPFEIDWNGFFFSEFDYRYKTIVLPLKERLEARGEKLWINVNYVAFTKQNNSAFAYLHDDAEEYAEFVLATLIHMKRTHGVVPDSWEIILEPDNVVQWDGAAIGRAIVATSRRLREAGMNVPLIAPSVTCIKNAEPYFDGMLATPGAANLIEYAYHRYCGATDEQLSAIWDRASQLGIRTSMLEKGGADYNNLHQDLTVANVSAWQQYVLAFPRPDDNGGQYFLISKDPDRLGTRLGSRARFLGQYFRYVRHNAVRFAASSDEPSFDPVAFENENGSVVVVVNAAKGGKIAIRGLPAGTYGVTHSTGPRTMDLGEFVVSDGVDLDTEIPGKGVISIFDVDYRPSR